MKGEQLKMGIDVPLLRVLLVDDEPYIRQGLAALIDWESEGYYIAGEASNGKNAIQLLENNDYDLILSDIKMPEMDGIEFISYVVNNKLSNARFVILSGYYDFQYAKTAIQCGCCDYILKPVQTEELLNTIRKIMDEYQKEADTQESKRDYEKAFLDRHLSAVIWGKYDCINLNYVKEKMLLSDKMAYIHCEISLNDEKFLALSEDDKRAQQRRLYSYASRLLKNYSDHIIYDIMKHTQCYDIGIVYSSTMSQERGMRDEEWLKWLLKELTERVGYEVVACMGSKVSTINMISDSFREAIMIRSFRFYKKNNKNVSITGNESSSKGQKDEYFKRQLDDLIHVIEINDKFKIKEYAKALYYNMMGQDVDPDVVGRNIQYLLYRLLGLAYDQDADINQEEIMQYIRETVFTSKTNSGSELKFQQFVADYSDYLTQLKQNTAKGTINLIETEIEENYGENISLKSLGEKYYINSAYLGQVFKKKYGCAFKDYLNNIRIRKAAEMMLGTDKMVYEIAVEVGYKNQEYFINKFEEVYGVTPTRFRKRNLNNHGVL
jgi:two-component system response regulator YesN